MRPATGAKVATNNSRIGPLTPMGIAGLRLLDSQEIQDGGAYFNLAQKTLCVADMALDEMAAGLKGRYPDGRPLRVDKWGNPLDARIAARCFEVCAAQLRLYAEDIARMVEAQNALTDEHSLRAQLESMRDLYEQLAPELAREDTPQAALPAPERADSPLDSYVKKMPIGRRKVTHGDPRDGLTRPRGGWKAYKPGPAVV